MSALLLNILLDFLPSPLCPFHSSFIPSQFLNQFHWRSVQQAWDWRKDLPSRNPKHNGETCTEILQYLMCTSFLLYSCKTYLECCQFQQHFLALSISSGPSSVHWVHTRLFAPRALQGDCIELNKHRLMPAFLTWKQQIVHAWCSPYNFYIWIIAIQCVSGNELNKQLQPTPA